MDLPERERAVRKEDLMKIIKRGCLPGEKTMRATCNHCHTIFEFKEKEAKLEFDRNEGFYRVQCPVCANAVFKDSR